MNSYFHTFRSSILHRLQFKNFLLLLATIFLASIITLYLKSSQGYWLMIASLLSFCLDSKILSERFYLLFVILAVGIASLVLISSLLHLHTLLLAVFLLAITFITVYLGLMYSVLWGFMFICGLFTNLTVGLGVSSVEVFERFFCVATGFFITFLVQLLFRNSLEKDVCLNLANGFFQLEKLSRTIFACYLTHNYLEEYFLLEKKMHQERSNFLYDIAHARKFLKKMKNGNQQKLKNLIAKIEECYEALLALSLLIYRVEDRSTYQVAEKELLSIGANIEKQFHQFGCLLKKPKQKFDPINLNENIYELADVNQRVMQVVAKEPIVFVIFVQDLYGLEKLITEVYPMVAHE